MPIFVKKKLGFKYITHPTLVKWMGPMIGEHVKEENREKVINSLFTQIPSNAYFEQNLYYDIDKNEIPSSYQDHCAPQYSYTLEDISDLEKTYAKITSNYRNNKIKKASANIIIEERHDVNLFYDIHKKSFDRQGMQVPYSKNLFSSYAKKLLDANIAKLLFAVDKQGNVHSVSMLIWDEKSAYYHIAGDDPTLRKSGSAIFLIWHCIELVSNELGLKTFDFEGSMLPSIERVRKDFGAKKKYYQKIRKYNSSTFKFLSQIKK